MARITTYPNDIELTGQDRVLGTTSDTSGTVNFPLSSISTFITGNILGRTPIDNSIPVFSGGRLVESFATNNITEESYSGSSIIASAVNVLTIGNIDPDIFDSTILVVGNRLLLQNGNNSFITTISAIDAAARTITLFDTLSTEQQVIFGNSGTGTNTINIFSNAGFTLQGPVSTPDGNIYNQRDGSVCKTWSGTEEMFQALSDPDDNTFYFTT